MPRRHEDDDGRTIADMNIEGMPWHRRRQGGAPGEPLGRRDALRAALWAGLAGFCVAACFLAVIALFILFCTRVWLR